MEGRNHDETVSSAFVPAQTQYLVVDNGGKNPGRLQSRHLNCFDIFTKSLNKFS